MVSKVSRRAFIVPLRYQACLQSCASVIMLVMMIVASEERRKPLQAGGRILPIHMMTDTQDKCE